MSSNTVNADIIMLKGRDGRYHMPYTEAIPTADTDVLGGVMVDGDTIIIDNNGVISVDSTALSGGRKLVESKKPTANSPSWYNLYSDGYLEQGGEFIATSGTTIGQITFTKTFENTYYMPILTCISYNAGDIDNFARITELTTTGMKVFDASGRTYRWECKGYVASS